MNIKKGDTVFILTGGDRGKSGKVLRALPKEHRVVVEGVNVRTRHLKKSRDTKQGGGIVKREMPIHISNVRTEARKKAQKKTKGAN